MGLRVIGRNLDIGDVLRSQAEEKINEVVAKYAERGSYTGSVTVGKSGQGFKTDCTLHLAHWGDMHVTGEAADAYQSLSVAVEKIAKQMRRNKRRRSDHVGHGAGASRPDGMDGPANDDHDEDDLDIVETTSAGAAVIAENVGSVRAMSVLGAVAAFEGSKAPVLVFRNAGTGRVNVLYRRDDGHYGWVDIG